MRTLTPRRGERRAASEHYARQLRVDDYASTWRAGCDYAGLCRRVRVPAGQTVVTPELVDVAGTDPAVLTVRLLPGMLVADIAAQAPRLANALGGARLTVTAVGTDYARLVLHRTDPLGDPFTVALGEVDGFLGVGEDGRDIGIPWHRRIHALVQGNTGTGKSTWLYGQLAPLAGRDDVELVGIDASGIVLRPWAGARGAAMRVSGLGDDLKPHVELLRALCDDMDARLDLLPPGVDNLATSRALPLRVVLLEEFSALLRTVDADRKVSAVARPLLGRLVSEGRKVGYRVLAALPRADAQVLGGGFRDQCGLRVSFACEPDGFRMCHSATAGIDADEHARAAPGVAVVTAPGIGTARMRAGDLTYADYCERVAAGLAR